MFGRIAGAALPGSRPVDDIDDADDADEPRTKGQRAKVRTEGRTPQRARTPAGGSCDFRRGFVDVVDFVGSSMAEQGGGLPRSAALTIARPVLLYRGEERFLSDGILVLPVEDFLRALVPGRPPLAAF